MAIETLGAALQQINRLFAGEGVTGFSDSELLARFVAARDGPAFEALVARHGPLVLSVCRGILRDTSDAEDAFQATFLILVKKSGSFRGHVALGPWLYRVAYRVAIRANAAAGRRRVCERRAGEMGATSSKFDQAVSDEQLKTLHEEIARLPEKIRRAIVLCDLQQIPQDRAARDLRLSQRTLQRRLSAGRERLKARLIRRGMAPDGGGMIAAMFVREARGAVPAAWGEGIVRAALATVKHTTTAGLVSAAARELVQGVLKIMLLQKVAIASGTLLAAGLVAWGASAAVISLRPGSSVQQKAEAVVPQGIPQRTEKAGKVTISGRVVGPDKEPVSGAKLYASVAHGFLREPFPAAVQATTGPDGRFELSVLRAKSGDDHALVAAMAPNCGVSWAEVSAERRTDDVTIQLVRDLPMIGEIIDLQGKPVAGATLRVLEINAGPGEYLGFWLKSTDLKEADKALFEKQDIVRDGIDVSGIALTVKTDAEGRFKLAGVGHNRTIRARLDGPSIASQYLEVVTLPGVPVAGKHQPKPGSTTYYGSYFRYVAAPTKPVVGVVRDKETRKPLAGVTVESNKLAGDSVPGRNIVQTKTDAEGRYRLTGLPKGEGNMIRLVPGDDQPYVSVHALVPNSPGLEPVTVDFELKRGIWIEGKVTEKVTGKPVAAYVDYFALDNNPHVRDHPGFDGTIPPTWGIATKEDGSYRVVGLPGPGMIAVFYTGRHLLAGDRDDEYGAKETIVFTFPRQLGLLINYTALARIDPAVSDQAVKRDVALDPGWTFTGALQGPDGKPLVGARSFGLSDRDDGRIPMKRAEFTVVAFNPRGPRDVFFVHQEKGLVGEARAPKENGGSVTVRMEPGATITGRLVDGDGEPRAGIELQVWIRHEGRSLASDWSEYSHSRIGTDREGRFRAGGLLPNYAFRFQTEQGELRLGDAPGSGQTKDLGDVRISGRQGD